MKHIFLFLIGFMLCGAIAAQINYGIKIAGTGLNSDNAGAINGDKFPYLTLNQGSITYDHSKKTFTLTDVNAKVTAESFMDIQSSAEAGEYKINLVGENIINTEYYTFCTYQYLTIEGSGSLNVKSENGTGIYVRSKLTIRNTTVEVTGKWAIAGFNGTSNENLKIENSHVKTYSNDGCICYFQNITLTDCDITKPADAEVAASASYAYSVMSNDTVVKAEVVIKPNSITNYGIFVANTELNSANIETINNDSFPGLGLTSGTITYDHSTKTFTLDGVKANVTDGNFIRISNLSDIAEYKINLINDNAITLDAASIVTYRSLTIEGDGSLKNTSASYSGFYILSSLTIKNTTVEAIGEWGIAGENGKIGEKLIIENSTVKATGTSGSISDFQTINLINCEITKPAGAIVDNNGSNGQAVMLGGAVVTSEVVITPKTGIDNVESELIFSIYPNPASNIINIVAEKANELITISDLSGKIVYSEQASEKQSSINISQLSAGMYIIRIGNAEAKFVKE